MAAQTSSPEAFDFLVRRDDLHRYEFRAALPKTMVGKILRRTLRDEELAKKKAS